LPTIIRVDGILIVIYPNDHSPAHVHVIGAGWLIVVNLSGPRIAARKTRKTVSAA
jgi:hypothetical protein